MNNRVFLLATAMVATVLPAVGQDADNGACQAINNALVKARSGILANSDTAFRNAFASLNATDFLRVLKELARGLPASALCNIQNNRSELEAGSTSSDTASSSLTQKGGAAQILTFAVENGGLQRELSGTTVTFRGKPVGLLEAFRKYDLFQVLDAIESSPVKRELNRFAFAISFDTSRGDMPGTLLANSQQLSAWSARVELVNQRDAKSRRYASQWRQLALSTDSAAATDAEIAAIGALRNSDPFNAWEKAMQARLKVLDDELPNLQSRLKDPQTRHEAAAQLEALMEKFKRIVSEEVVALSRIPNLPGIPAALGAVQQTWAKLDERAGAIANYVQKGHLVTFDWATKRDLSLPDLYTNTLIWEFSPARSRVDDFTFNASVNWYRVAPATPAAAGRFRNFNAVAEYAVPFGKLEGVGQFILSFAGKYQRVAKSVVNATSLTGAVTTAPATTASPGVFSTVPPAIANLLPTLEGNLGAFQVKFSIPGGKSGIRIPLAFTAATRSEVFDKPDYRANIGIAFNIDALFAKK